MVRENQEARNRIIIDECMDSYFVHTIMCEKHKLNPFFLDSKGFVWTADAKQSRLREFYAKIYRCWSPRVQAHMLKEDSRYDEWETGGRVGDFQEGNEMALLWECDWAVYQSGARVDRSTGDATSQARTEFLSEKFRKAIE